MGQYALSVSGYNDAGLFASALFRALAVFARTLLVSLPFAHF